MHSYGQCPPILLLGFLLVFVMECTIKYLFFGGGGWGGNPVTMNFAVLSRVPLPCVLYWATHS
jgi:hypothetical protein